MLGHDTHTSLQHLIAFSRKAQEFRILVSRSYRFWKWLTCLSENWCTSCLTSPVVLYILSFLFSIFYKRFSSESACLAASRGRAFECFGGTFRLCCYGHSINSQYLGLYKFGTGYPSWSTEFPFLGRMFHFRPATWRIHLMRWFLYKRIVRCRCFGFVVLQKVTFYAESLDLLSRSSNYWLSVCKWHIRFCCLWSSTDQGTQSIQNRAVLSIQAPLTRLGM